MARIMREACRVAAAEPAEDVEDVEGEDTYLFSISISLYYIIYLNSKKCTRTISRPRAAGREL